MTTNKPGIVLNRMYVGTYLNTNLGHEVINMYTTDDDKHYLYLNATGDFDKKHSKKVGYMLLTKYVEPNCIEVLGMATGLNDIFNPTTDKGNKSLVEKNDTIQDSQKEIVENTTYGGVTLYDIFNDSERQNVYVTYEAEEVYIPVKEKHIFLRFIADCESTAIKEEGNSITFYIKGYNQAKTSLKQYFYPDGDNPESGYNTLLSKLIKIDKYWQQLDNKGNVDLNYKPREESLFDICCIQNSENDFSNALAYFMKKYPELWCSYFNSHINSHRKI